MISSTRSSCSIQRRGERIRVDDLPVDVDPLDAQHGERAAQAALGLERVDASLCGATIRKLAGPPPRGRGCGRAARSRARSRSRPRARSRLARPVVVGRSRARRAPGGRPSRCRRRRRGEPARALRRCVETMISLGRGSSCTRASFAACTGPSRRRTPARGRPTRAAAAASARAACPPRRGACRRRRRSLAAARSQARSR